jgi:signal transduction histidine kinase
LDDLGLVAALRSLVREFGERSGISARFTHDPPDWEVHLSKEIELSIYRIAQEALNNVEKHSNAAHAAVSLSCPRNTQVALIVRDDGKGFVPRAGKGTGSGIQNMTERAALLRGTVEVESARRRGAKVTVRIPLEIASRRRRAK